MRRLRIRTLEARHAALERDLAEELARPAPNPIRVRQIKRRKLALKDDIAGLSRSPQPA